jgi:hypothetical protein
MAAPATAVVGQVVTAGFWNTEVRDQFNGLRVAGSYSSGTQITIASPGTEQVVASVTATLESGRTYLILGSFTMESGTTPTAHLYRFRYKSGAWAVGSTDMTSSTVIQSKVMEYDGSGLVREHFLGITATGFSGSTSIVMTILRQSGSGNAVLAGGTNSISMQVIPIGSSS